MARGSLEIRLLGELEVVRDGRVQPLPASRKTRALLGYLVTTGRPQLRERLCEVLWNLPDDPRAALRWSLTKIRPLLDETKRVRLVADRERVAFEPHGADVDLAAVRAALARGVSGASEEVLESAAARFRGEFLEGLDLPDCYRFHDWCIGERESARTLWIAILEELCSRAKDRPDKALSHARARLAIDPLAEESHVAVVEALAALGRPQEAHKQIEACKRIFQQELGRTPSAALERARAAIASAAATSAAPAPKSETTARPPETPPVARVIVGRQAECDVIGRLVDAVSRGAPAEVLLVTGDPGIGKTCLLEEVGARVVAARGRVLRGRSFEAEMVRPYGAWIDALRSVALGAAAEPLRAEIAPLLPELGVAPPGAADKDRLFDAVARLLSNLSADGAPTAVVLDDIHWIDEASAGLAHYVARALGGSRVLIAFGARAGELPDNPAALRLVRALAKGGRLRQLSLAPLDAADTEALVRTIAPAVAADRVFADSQGNPLFVLEAARALVRGEGALESSLANLIEDRLAQLDERAQRVLPWAAAFGRGFDPDVLARTTALGAAELLDVFAALERRGILRMVTLGSGEVGYDFAHDLVRHAAYRRFSEPRRRLAHLSIARALAAAHDPDGALQGDVAHHAALGGDAELSVRATVAAGERCLRLVACEEAAELADRAAPLLEKLAAPARTELGVALQKLYVHPAITPARAREVQRDLARLVVESDLAGLRAEVHACFALSSTVYYHRKDFGNAVADMLRSAEAGRAADPTTAVRSLAMAAKCLALLERDLPHASALIREAETLAQANEVATLDIHWARGLVEHFVGDPEAAQHQLEEAVVHARRLKDAWGEWECLADLSKLDLERGRPEAALERVGALQLLAHKLGDGSEIHFSVALEALARRALRQERSGADVEKALEALRRIDSSAFLAYALNHVADAELSEGHPSEAARCAEEALRAAERVGRRGDVVLARALLARAALATNDRRAARAHVEAVRADLAELMTVSSRARTAILAVAVELGVSMTAPASTQGPALNE